MRSKFRPPVWIGNFSIPTAVQFIGILAPLFVILGGVAAMGFLNLHSSERATDRTAQTYLDRILTSNAAVSHLQDLHVIGLEMVAAPERRLALETAFEGKKDAVWNDLAHLSQESGSQTEIRSARKAYTQFLAEHAKLVNLLAAGQYPVARQIAVTTAQAAAATAAAQLGHLAISNTAGIQLIASAARVQSERAARTVLALVAMALLLGCIEVVILARYIKMLTKPVSTLERTAALIAQGDLTQALPPIETKGEIARLAQNFARMVGSVLNLVRETVKTADEFQANSAQLATSSTEAGYAATTVANASAEVASGASKQVSDVTSSAERASTIAKAAKALAGNVQTASHNTSLMAGLAEDGRKRLDDVLRKMQQAEQTVVSTAAAVRRLGDMGKHIGQISDLIATFAKKTNFLALNAGIEAARAGEEGRGFGVLALEIRKLAIESGQAAQQIASMVETIQNETLRAIQAMDAGNQEVLEGVGALENAAFALELIVEGVQSSDGELKGITQATRQVSQGAQDLESTMRRVATTCQQTASGAKSVAQTAERQNATAMEIAVSAQVLAQLAVNLKGLVRQFKIEA
ncbi:MAG: methyl-accepting chemotaxis protein [Cyanobacteria bacterium REEB65]|nr:methyl-accepting chemotaxis protein [Cyanobacteria bacterium REEB65]